MPGWARRRYPPFVDRPDNRAINDGYKLLQSRAVGEHRLTRVGRQLGPFNRPRMARMVLAAHDTNALDEVLTLPL